MAAIKTAIIGYGLSARVFHLPFVSLLPGFSLCAISSSQGPQVTAAWPGIAVYEQAIDLIDKSDAELVIITAPNVVHFDLARRALMAGKHVLLEKPFVTAVADGEELIRLAAEHGRVLSVFQNRRWDGDFQTVQRLIDEKRVGNVRYFEAHFDRFRPHLKGGWREAAGLGSGVLFDLGPHLIDQAVQLFGVPEAITADVRTLRAGARADDFFHILLQYPGHLAVLQASPFAAGPTLRFRLEGDAGTYTKYGLDAQEDRLKAGVVPDHDGWGADTPDRYGTLHTADEAISVPTANGGYEHFFEGLARAIRQGGQPPVTAEDALVTIRLIELAMASSQRGQTLRTR